ncbi:folate family ECF transporter S component [Anaerosporobacter sp.]|uniref:folate family ECF transporter S component n=1 Tax=Anaerosporobacter sp. TaxID=1872529 RepID=UPI00286F1BB8|nr:folate family ECF transporter S component [Anaerosporobacter sp.]
MHFISKEALNLKKQITNFSKLRNLVFCALMVAMYIIVSFFDISITQTIEIRLGFIIIAAAGMLGGPIMGLSVGALGDVVKMLITGGKGSSFFFGFTVTYALMGFLFGLVFYKSKVTIARAIAASVCEFAISIFFNTWNLSILFGSPYKALFFSRLPKSATMLVVNAFLLFIIMRALQTAFRQNQIAIES